MRTTEDLGLRLQVSSRVHKNLKGPGLSPFLQLNWPPLSLDFALSPPVTRSLFQVPRAQI